MFSLKFFVFHLNLFFHFSSQTRNHKKSKPYTSIKSLSGKWPSFFRNCSRWNRLHWVRNGWRRIVCHGNAWHLCAVVSVCCCIKWNKMLEMPSDAYKKMPRLVSLWQIEAKKWHLLLISFELIFCCLFSLKFLVFHLNLFFHFSPIIA